MGTIVNARCEGLQIRIDKYADLVNCHFIRCKILFPPDFEGDHFKCAFEDCDIPGGLPIGAGLTIGPIESFAAVPSTRP